MQKDRDVGSLHLEYYIRIRKSYIWALKTPKIMDEHFVEPERIEASISDYDRILQSEPDN